MRTQPTSGDGRAESGLDTNAHGGYIRPMRIGRSNRDGITNRMPANKAPPELARSIPALDLPEVRTAAPTLKSNESKQPR